MLPDEWNPFIIPNTLPEKMIQVNGLSNSQKANKENNMTEKSELTFITVLRDVLLNRYEPIKYAKDHNVNCDILNQAKSAKF